jgi:Peptidase family M49
MRYTQRAVLCSALAAVIAVAACRTQEAPVANAAVPTSPAPGANAESSELQRKAARFAPTDISADLSGLAPGDRQVLAKLVEASRIIDALFLRQVWAGNDAMLIDLVRDETPEGRARLHYFLINKGPWDRVDHNQPFVAGAPVKPAGANFYPEGASKAELEQWMQKLGDAERARANGFFSVIRRGPAGAFTIVPYNVEYQNELTRAAALLREAAELGSEPTLKAYLTRRADAFLSNDYYDSDVAWMEMKGAIEPTIGPYEVYEDEFFNYKASFESYVTILDENESAKLQKFSGELQEIENRLPIDPKYRNPKIGALAPLVVVNEIYASGDGNRGVQTAAFNLPNDERVLREKGAKRVMLKNVQDAKFAKTLVPISKVVLSAADQEHLAFDAFFTHIVLHEMMHGLGPHNIVVGGRETTVRKEMKDASSFLEEAKADISGLYALQSLIDKGVISASMQDTLYPTFLASCFRSIRFGVNEAHGKGIAVQLNYLLDQGGFVVKPDGTFAVEPGRIKEGVTALTREIMTIQAEGDYGKAKALGDRLGVVRPEVQRALDRLTDVPIDIEPRFTTADQLLTEQ